jgi:hypothetical protein
VENDKIIEGLRPLIGATHSCHHLWWWLLTDKHLVSIIEISNCRLLCTKDAVAMPYIKDSQFYDKSSPPKIYTGSRNSDLLMSGNIVALWNMIG